MLKTTYVVVLLMSCLNGSALFSSALSEAELDTVKRYCRKDERVEITSENLMEAIVRLSVAKIRVGNILDTLRSAACAKFEDNEHLLALGLSSWDGRLSLLEEEIKAFDALTVDLGILNRVHSTLFSSSGS